MIHTKPMVRQATHTQPLQPQVVPPVPGPPVLLVVDSRTLVLVDIVDHLLSEMHLQRRKFVDPTTGYIRLYSAKLRLRLPHSKSELLYPVIRCPNPNFGHTI